VINEMQITKSRKRNANNEMQNLHIIVSEDKCCKAVLYSIAYTTKSRYHYIY